jgi:peptidoglycan/xylan/chitin deacetylase (PgdA/CDA1 family)
MTSTIKRTLVKTGALNVIQRLTAAGRVDILLYHGFSPGPTRDPRFPKLMPIGQFEQQVRLLVRHGKPLRLEDLAQGTREGIVLTFDDGYANNFHLAFPVLQKYQFPATILVATGFVDRTVPLWGDWLEFVVNSAPHRDSLYEWRNEQMALPLASPENARVVVAQLKRRLRAVAICDVHDFVRSLASHLHVRYDWTCVPEELRPLQWDQVRAMRRSGLVSFGSHTVSHPVLSRCSEAIQRSEIVDSKRRLDRELGEPCTIFAYPFGKRGDYSEATKRLALEAGHQLILTAESGYNAPSSWDCSDLKRWGAEITSEELSFIVSGGPVISRYLKRLRELTAVP